MGKFDLLITEAERLSVTDNPSDLDVASMLFENVLDTFCYYYSNPGEPQAECDFCGAYHALPGVYGEDAYTGEELETEIELDNEVYWARVWATRALDILDCAEEPCCEEREKLWTTFEGD